MRRARVVPDHRCAGCDAAGYSPDVACKATPMTPLTPEQEQAMSEISDHMTWCQMHQAFEPHADRELVAALRAENATLRAALEESMRVLQVAAERAIDMGNAVVALGGADINRGQFLSLVEETWRTQRAALTAKEGKG
jgi:hypothetical protein